MQSTQLSYIRQKIDGYLIELYNDKTGVLPPLSIIHELILLTEKDGNFDNTKYANQIYHVLQDLASHDHWSYGKVVEVDEENMAVKYEIVKQPMNSPEIKSYSTAHYHKDNGPLHSEEKFNLFKGKDLEEINQNVKTYSVRKFGALFSPISDGSPTMSFEQILNIEKILGGLDPQY